MSLVKMIPWAVGFALQAVAAQAELPIAEDKPEATLKRSGEVTFEPLGVAAILHNPRAHVSASRLYTQSHRPVLTWPHTMMFGATLIPLKVLVEHLDSTSKHIHPAVTALVLSATVSLPMISDTGFREFPLDISNAWLKEAINFPPSTTGRDIMIVNIPPPNVPDSAQGLYNKKRPSYQLLNLLSFLTFLILIGEIIFSILVADIWALTLFFCYGTHWLAGIAISTNPPIHRKEMNIPDSRPACAIYQRISGGLVIFKGRRDAFDRPEWEFHDSRLHGCFHWLWISTGTLSAICSIACMVNMRGYMQLAFLGLLTYSSLAEIMASRIWRNLDTEPARSRCCLVSGIFLHQAVVRAAVEVDTAYRLQRFDWLKLHVLPSVPVFQRMTALLASINDFQSTVESGEERVPEQGPRGHKDVEEALKLFTEEPDQAVQALAHQIRSEVETALEVWWQRERTNH